MFTFEFCDTRYIDMHLSLRQTSRLVGDSILGRYALLLSVESPSIHGFIHSSSRLGQTNESINCSDTI